MKPTITVRQGEPFAVVRAMLAERPNTAALVVGAPAAGPPGPLLAEICGAEPGSMPCPVMIIPGSLGNDALDRLS